MIEDLIVIGLVERLNLKLILFQCEELWLDKAHIPRMSQAHGLSKLAAYSLSVMDGKRVTTSLSSQPKNYQPLFLTPFTFSHSFSDTNTLLHTTTEHTPNANPWLIRLMFVFQTRITKYDLCGHVWEFHFNKVCKTF